MPQMRIRYLCTEAIISRVFKYKQILPFCASSMTVPLLSIIFALFLEKLMISRLSIAFITDINLHCFAAIETQRIFGNSARMRALAQNRKRFFFCTTLRITFRVISLFAFCSFVAQLSSYPTL